MSEQASNDVLMSLPERNEGETFRAWYARLTEAQQDEYDARSIEWTRAVESAERAIVDAADKVRDNRLSNAAFNALATAVDAWRKLKGM